MHMYAYGSRPGIPFSCRAKGRAASQLLCHQWLFDGKRSWRSCRLCCCASSAPRDLRSAASSSVVGAPFFFFRVPALVPAQLQQVRL